MNGKHRVVVLGAGYAGMAAARRLANQVDPDTVSITVVNARDHFVERPRLHQVATGQRIADPKLSDLLGSAAVDVTIGWVHRIDLDDRRVVVATVDGTDVVDYDTLIYGLGTSVDTGTIPGIDEHAVTLDPAEAPRLAAALDDLDGGTVAVCGGGLTGIEAATEIAEQYPNLMVRLVTRGEPADWLSAKARRYIDRAFDRLGVQTHPHSDIAAIEADAIRLADGTAIGFDQVIWAGGFRVSPLAAESGLAVDAAGRALVDATLRSVSHPDVYVVGDAAAARGRWGDSIAFGCRTATFVGLYAPDAIAARLAGREPGHEFRFRYIHQCISLGRRDAVVQFVNRDSERRNGPVLTGRPAIWYKDLVLKSGVWTLRHPGPFLPHRRVRAVTSTEAMV